MTDSIYLVAPQQTLSITVNDRKAINFTATVIYRIEVPDFTKSVLCNIFLFVAIRNFNVSRNCAFWMGEL